MRAALAAHDEVLRGEIEGHGGWLFKHTGDGVCAAFASPRSAVDAAIRRVRQRIDTCELGAQTVATDQGGLAVGSRQRARGRGVDALR